MEMASLNEWNFTLAKKIIEAFQPNAMQTHENNGHHFKYFVVLQKYS